MPPRALRRGRPRLRACRRVRCGEAGPASRMPPRALRRGRPRFAHAAACASARQARFAPAAACASARQAVHLGAIRGRHHGALAARAGPVTSVAFSRHPAPCHKDYRLHASSREGGSLTLTGGAVPVFLLGFVPAGAQAPCDRHRSPSRRSTPLPHPPPESPRCGPRGHARSLESLHLPASRRDRVPAHPTYTPGRTPERTKQRLKRLFDFSAARARVAEEQHVWIRSLPRQSWPGLLRTFNAKQPKRG